MARPPARPTRTRAESRPVNFRDARLGRGRAGAWRGGAEGRGVAGAPWVSGRAGQGAGRGPGRGGAAAGRSASLPLSPRPGRLSRPGSLSRTRGSRPAPRAPRPAPRPAARPAPSSDRAPPLPARRPRPPPRLAATSPFFGAPTAPTLHLCRPPRPSPGPSRLGSPTHPPDGLLVAGGKEARATGRSVREGRGLCGSRPGTQDPPL